MSEKVAAANLVNKGAQGAVLAKLIIFSLSLAFAPISSYFFSLSYVWNGNSTYAAITAIIAANIVLVSYIVISIIEDKGDQERSASVKEAFESRKSQ